jgi:glycosyltransferase involved in cell wall biosynthesis
VAVESQLCGTPVITTDWGVFTETVQQGKTGFRCRTMNEITTAAENVKTLNRKYIRKHAMESWTLDVVKWKYQEYFDRLYDLWDKGWYQEH